MWKFYAILSAIFAALTAILVKVGVKGIDSNLATAIRTTVVLVLTWGIVFVMGSTAQIKSISKFNIWFLVLSGLATGLSWIFYFKAIQMGDVSKVAPVDKLSVALTIILSIFLLNEPAEPKVLIGGALIVIGSLVILL
jgi:bacterial/archaeal transporter family protein